MINLPKTMPKILVVGDLIVDSYLWGSCNRISPEAPVQIINVESKNSVLGGAGNVVNNLNALGASVDIVSVVGDCKVGTKIVSLLEEIDVSSQYLITQVGRISSKKSRIIAKNQQVIRCDHESTDAISDEAQQKIVDIFTSIVSEYEIVLLSDYGKGVLTESLTKSLLAIAKKHAKKVLIDPKGDDYSKYKGAYLLTPNKEEAQKATNINIIDNDSLKSAIVKLKQDCDLGVSIITLSENGVAVYGKNMRIHPTVAQAVFDVTGAGDTVLASIGFALACGKNIDAAVKLSNLAAGVVVGKIGSATATIDEIVEYESSIHKSNSSVHIKTMMEITGLAKRLKEQNKRIVFTNGCFDILHVGHIKYLEEAKSFGDILILGLNSDSSVKKIKGDNRPINVAADRAYALAALEAVDYVVLFDEDTPYELIKNIRPNILVKGGDYKDKKVVGQDIVNELKIVEFTKGKSTSLIIKKIQNLSHRAG